MLQIVCILLIMFLFIAIFLLILCFNHYLDLKNNNKILVQKNLELINSNETLQAENFILKTTLEKKSTKTTAKKTTAKKSVAKKTTTKKNIVKKEEK